MKLKFYFAHPVKFREYCKALEQILEKELNIDIINPFTDVGVFYDVEGVLKDIEAVKNVDGIICYYPVEDTGCMGEMTIAKLENKPVIIFTTPELGESIWLKWIASTICYDCDQLIQSLKLLINEKTS